MTHVPPSLADVARQLLVHDAGEGQRTQDLADVMERAFQALHNRLAPLIGAAGFNALFGRAVKLAAREFPFLPAIVAPNSSPGALRPAVEGREPAEVRDGLVAILANFISLLVIFIGENLALRKVHEAWSDMPLHAPESPSKKAPQ